MSLQPNVLEEMDHGCGPNARTNVQKKAHVTRRATSLDKILVLLSFDHTPYKVQLAGFALYG